MTHPIERTQLIGPRQQLVAVVTEPLAPEQGVQRPMVVILNSGIIHRVGPNRLGVLLARALARLGCAVLRFDLSGIGDSEPRADAKAPLDAALADIREALDWAEERLGMKRFILVGLCSGADHAVIYSGSDPRVVGAVLMDPTIPPTAKFRLRRVLRRLTSVDLWRRVFTGEASAWQRVLSSAGRGAGDDARPRTGLDLASREVRDYLESAYRQALADSRELLVAFTDGMPAQHNYPEQLRDALPGVAFGSRCRVEYFHGADHTFTEESHRDRLLLLVGEWLRGAPFRMLLAFALAAVIGVDLVDGSLY